MSNHATLTNFIDGRRGSATDAVMPIVDPRTGAKIGRATVSGPQDVDRALHSAQEAFRTFRRTVPAGRQRALLRIADAIEDNATAFANIECRETGKSRRQMLQDEIPQCVDQLRFFAGAARLLEGTSTGEYAEGLSSSIRREPVGVCAQITPWNYPLMMAVWKIAPAIAAGNTTVVKPAETTPTSTIMLAELASRFLPPGVVNVVLGDRATGRMLVEHPIPAMLSITGSTRAGIQVARAAAADLKQTHLELGGNAPALVFGDADIEATADGIMAAATYNAGQDCTAATRVLAHASIHDDLLNALVKRAEALTCGPEAHDGDLDVGPLNSAAQLERVLGLLKGLPSHATLRTGGHRVGDTGYYLAPTVISGLVQQDELIQEEIFAPVVTVQKFSTEEEALHLANDQPYGLAASVWTTDHSRILRTTAELDFGCVWINTHGPLTPEMPHGGFKQSGHGKDLSAYGLADYTRIKHVMSAIGDPI